MKTLKNILFYISLMLALTSYISYEFYGSLLSSGIKLEIPDTQTESETREYEERIHAEEYAYSNSPELKIYYLSRPKQHCIQLLFVSFDYKPCVWIPPKHA